MDRRAAGDRRLNGVTFGFIESSSQGWTKASVWSALALGSACLIAFAYFEARASFQMVPFGSCFDPQISAARICSRFFCMPFVGNLLFFCSH